MYPLAAISGSPNEYVDYAASKAADDGIRVNVVRPSFIHTDMHKGDGEAGRVDWLQVFQ